MFFCGVCMRQLLDVFGHRSNVSLVFDYMDTDLEVGFYFTYLMPWFHVQFSMQNTAVIAGFPAC